MPESDNKESIKGTQIRRANGKVVIIRMKVILCSLFQFEVNDDGNDLKIGLFWQNNPQMLLKNIFPQGQRAKNRNVPWCAWGGL